MKKKHCEQIIICLYAEHLCILLESAAFDCLHPPSTERKLNGLRIKAYFTS